MSLWIIATNPPPTTADGTSPSIWLWTPRGVIIGRYLDATKGATRFDSGYRDETGLPVEATHYSFIQDGNTVPEPPDEDDLTE